MTTIGGRPLPRATAEKTKEGSTDAVMSTLVREKYSAAKKSSNLAMYKSPVKQVPRGEMKKTLERYHRKEDTSVSVKPVAPIMPVTPSADESRRIAVGEGAKDSNGNIAQNSVRSPSPSYNIKHMSEKGKKKRIDLYKNVKERAAAAARKSADRKKPNLHVSVDLGPENDERLDLNEAAKSAKNGEATTSSHTRPSALMINGTASEPSLASSYLSPIERPELHRNNSDPGEQRTTGVARLAQKSKTPQGTDLATNRHWPQSPRRQSSTVSNQPGQKSPSKKHSKQKSERRRRPKLRVNNNGATIVQDEPNGSGGPAQGIQPTAVQAPQDISDEVADSPADAPSNKKLNDEARISHKHFDFMRPPKLWEKIEPSKAMEKKVLVAQADPNKEEREHAPEQNHPAQESHAQAASNVAKFSSKRKTKEVNAKAIKSTHVGYAKDQVVQGIEGAADRIPSTSNGNAIDDSKEILAAIDNVLYNTGSPKEHPRLDLQDVTCRPDTLSLVLEVKADEERVMELENVLQKEEGRHSRRGKKSRPDPEEEDVYDLGSSLFSSLSGEDAASRKGHGSADNTACGPSLLSFLTKEEADINEWKITPGCMDEANAALSGSSSAEAHDLAPGKKKRKGFLDFLKRDKGSKGDDDLPTNINLTLPMQTVLGEKLPVDDTGLKVTIKQPKSGSADKKSKTATVGNDAESKAKSPRSRNAAAETIINNESKLDRKKMNEVSEGPTQDVASSPVAATKRANKGYRKIFASTLFTKRKASKEKEGVTSETFQDVFSGDWKEEEAVKTPISVVAEPKQFPKKLDIQTEDIGEKLDPEGSFLEMKLGECQDAVTESNSMISSRSSPIREKKGTPIRGLPKSHGLSVFNFAGILFPNIQCGANDKMATLCGTDHVLSEDLSENDSLFSDESEVIPPQVIRAQSQIPLATPSLTEKEQIETKKSTFLSPKHSAWSILPLFSRSKRQETPKAAAPYRTHVLHQVMSFNGSGMEAVEMLLHPAAAKTPIADENRSSRMFWKKTSRDTANSTGPRVIDGTVFHVRLSLGYLNGAWVKRLRKIDTNHALVVGFAKVDMSSSFVTESNRAAESQPIAPVLASGKSPIPPIAWCSRKFYDKTKGRLYFSVAMETLGTEGMTNLFSEQTVKILLGVKRDNETIVLGSVSVPINGKEVSGKKIYLKVIPEKSRSRVGLRKGDKGKSFRKGDRVYGFDDRAFLRARIDVKRDITGPPGPETWGDQYGDDSSFVLSYISRKDSLRKEKRGDIDPAQKRSNPSFRQCATVTQTERMEGRRPQKRFDTVSLQERRVDGGLDSFSTTSSNSFTRVHTMTDKATEWLYQRAKGAGLINASSSHEHDNISSSFSTENEREMQQPSDLSDSL